MSVERCNYLGLETIIYMDLYCIPIARGQIDWLTKIRGLR